jgi:GPH family glycoside/pentoside/hexuronide:cation symporter
MGQSVTADIIDWDEMETGDRKEGSYTAVLNFIRKLGLALSAGVVGFGLQFSGYDATAELKSAETQRIILWLSGGIPAVCYGTGLLLFTRFRLDGPEHARIQKAIRAQREQRGPVRDRDDS